MKLTVFNGSPRGQHSNTRMLLEHFLDGFMTSKDNTYELAYLNHLKSRDKFVTMFGEAECVLLAFPLYTDAMPAMVKTFIESLEPLCGREGNPAIGFIVQSGFPEAIHSRALERYLEKLARRLGCRYIGTVIKGGVEGIRTMPSMMTRGLFKSLYLLGRKFGETGSFDRQIVLNLGKPERLTGLRLLSFRLIGRYLSRSKYWDRKLKENKAFDKRFARPYTDKAKS